MTSVSLRFVCEFGFVSSYDNFVLIYFDLKQQKSKTIRKYLYSRIILVVVYSDKNPQVGSQSVVPEKIKHLQITKILRIKPYAWQNPLTLFWTVYSLWTFKRLFLAIIFISTNVNQITQLKMLFVFNAHSVKIYVLSFWLKNGNMGIGYL